MHSVVSDGTDTPQEILEKVKAAGMALFSLTDHDAVKGSGMLLKIRGEDDPHLLPGVEFSCRDNEGKYHILGYGYDPEAPSILDTVQMGHSLRMQKVMARLEYLKTTFGVVFPEEELQRLMLMDNPGKPHIGNLMVKYGYAKTKEEAINDFIDGLHMPSKYIRPEQAIEGIIKAGGIPVLAHPAFGSGGELIVGDDLDRRVRHLMDFGLRGMEAFYSGFSPKLCTEALALAEKYHLFVTAGSDYHGMNKLVELGDTKLETVDEVPEGLVRFLQETGMEDVLVP